MWTAIVILFCGILSAASVCCDHQNARGRIQVKDGWLTDGAGRVRIFHGFNSVEKNFPWYPSITAQVKVLNDTQLALLRHWGFNVVRLGTMWAGAQPMEGMFNETYLSIMGDIITKLDKHGMMALLDMHQDVLTSVYGSYDGVPRWLIEKFPKPKHPYPWPFKKIRASPEGYLTQAISGAFQWFYYNMANAQIYCGKFWQKIVSTFNFEKHPNVLGYEFINEPFAGDIYGKPLLLLPGVAGKMNLRPLYNYLSYVIRQVDAEALVFYEPVTWGVMRNGEVIGTGFDQVPGGPDFQNRSVLAWHYYCWFITGYNDHDNYTTLLRNYCDKHLGPHVFEAVQKDVKQTGGGSFLTEFGICNPDGNPDSVSTIECEFVLGLADEYFQSWTYWDAEFFYPNGSINHYVVNAFSRPYARAIAGIPLNMTFNRTTGDFDFHFEYSPLVNAPTEIFVSPIQYPRGFSFTLSPGYQSHFNKTSNVLSVSRLSQRMAEREVVSLHLRRK